MIAKLYSYENLSEVTEITSFRMIENGIELIQTEKDSPIGPTIFRKLVFYEGQGYFDENTQEWFTRIEIESEGKILYSSNPPPTKSDSLVEQEKAQAIVSVVGAVVSGVAGAVKQSWAEAEAKEEQKKFTRWIWCCGIIFVMLMLGMIGSLIPDNENPPNVPEGYESLINKQFFCNDTQEFEFSTKYGWYTVEIKFNSTERFINGTLVGGNLTLQLPTDLVRHVFANSTQFIIGRLENSTCYFTVIPQSVLPNYFSFKIKYEYDALEPNNNPTKAVELIPSSEGEGLFDDRKYSYLLCQDEDWFKLIPQSNGGLRLRLLDIKGSYYTQTDNIYFSAYDENLTVICEFQYDYTIPYYENHPIYIKIATINNQTLSYCLSG